MRTFGFVLIAAAALAPTGCTTLVAESGTNLADLKDRPAVRAAFGPPASTGEDGGRAFEEYTTRRKIADPWLIPEMVTNYSRPFVWLGFRENATEGCVQRLVHQDPDLAAVFFFPQEVYHVGRRTLLGQRIRFTYAADGTVDDISLDGDPVLPIRPSKTGWAPPE